MSTHDNAPPPADWSTPCRCLSCDVCTPPPSIPPNVILSDN